MVNSKIVKSEKLITSLMQEKQRWKKSSEQFQLHFETLCGDVLLASAFLTYIGFFDRYNRDYLLKKWKGLLNAQKLKFKKELDLIEYLSLPSERIQWQSQKLPNDQLCTQNAIIMKNFNRFPLIIDPSGQAIQFMINHFATSENKLIRTSFIDDGFMKQLETCLRFGQPILIQDVEKIEPILNSVLNKEIMRTGGRTLIRVGDKEIDYNSNFRLFMITRNSNAVFTPDLCSRVTFVNFTVTLTSLQNQFINIYLHSERPDIEQKRTNYLKLQGESIIKLRKLEDDLLDKLNEQKGTNILENDEMIQSLSKIKSESSTIQQQMQSKEEVWQQINEVIDQYQSVSQLSSKLYFILQKLSDIDIMYQFSLTFYMNIVQQLLTSNEILEKVDKQENQQRIGIIKEQLLVVVYQKIE